MNSSPPSSSSLASPPSASDQNRCPFSINSLLDGKSSQNGQGKFAGTSAFSDAIKQYLPMLFAARGLIDDGTTPTMAPLSLLPPLLMDKLRLEEEDGKDNEDTEMPTSEESSQSEDDVTLAKDIFGERKVEMKEEEGEAFEEHQMEMKQEQKQTKEEQKEEEGTIGGTVPAAAEGCFMPWFLPVLPPPSAPLLHPPSTARVPPLLHPFVPTLFKSSLGLPAQFLLSTGTFPSVCGPCAPQSAQQQHHHHHQHQHKRKGGQIRFSNEQTDILESTFYVKKYLNNLERKKLAKALTLNERQVKTWFQNRRAKWRRQTPAAETAESREENSEMIATTTAAGTEHHHLHHHSFELYIQRQ